MFLRFVAPSDNSLGFEIHPGEFELDLLAMLEFCEEQQAFLGHLEGVQEDAEELAEEWVPAIELLHQLIAETDVDEVGEFPSGDVALQRCAEAMIADYKYRSVRCPVCDQTFAPNEISEEEFGYDERVVGGKKYVCPAGHVLSVFIRFDTRGTGLEPKPETEPRSESIEFEPPTNADELIDILTRAFNAGDKEAIDALTYWGDANDQQKASARQWLADMAGCKSNSGNRNSAPGSRKRRVATKFELHDSVVGGSVHQVR